MNQGTRYERRKCIICGATIYVEQIYNPHYSDWEDIGYPVCWTCGMKEREQKK